MKRHGDGDKQIWMTELGWSTQSTPRTPATSASRGPQVRGRDGGAARRVPHPGLPVPGVGPLRRRRVVVRAAGRPRRPLSGGHGLFRNNGSAKPAVSAFRALSRGISPCPCGGLIDTVRPAVRGQRAPGRPDLQREMGIDVKAPPTAASASGDQVEYRRPVLPLLRRRPREDADPLGLARLERRLEAQAHVRGGGLRRQQGDRTLTVKKVKRLPKAPTVASVTVTPVDATTVRVTGEVSTPKAQAARVSGKALVVFHKRKGTKWKRVHKVKRGAHRSVDVTKALAAGPLAREARLQGQEALQEVGLRPRGVRHRHGARPRGLTSSRRR